MLLTIRDASGEAVRRLEAEAAAGLHRTDWDLRRPAPDPIDFEVPGFSLGEPDWTDYAEFTESTWDLIRRGHAAMESLDDARDRIRYMRKALVDAPGADSALLAELEAFEAHLNSLRTRLQGDRTLGRFQEPMTPSILQRAFRLTSLWDTRQAPTKTQRDNLALARDQLTTFRADLVEVLETTLPALEGRLEAAGAVWTPGRSLPE